MSQYSTLTEARKNEVKLKALMPTYGIVKFPNDFETIPDSVADDGIPQEYGIATARKVVVDGLVVNAGEFMNSGLVSQTIDNAPSATQAAVRLFAMVHPGISDADAMAKVMSTPGVSAAAEEVLMEVFK